MASTDEPADQANVTQAMVVNGVHAVMNVTTVKASAGASNVYKFTKSFAFPWNGQHTTYKQSCVYALDAALKAALIAASAPMTQQ
jgi:hypothetical protein